MSYHHKSIVSTAEIKYKMQTNNQDAKQNSLPSMLLLITVSCLVPEIQIYRIPAIKSFPMKISNNKCYLPVYR